MKQILYLILVVFIVVAKHQHITGGKHQPDPNDTGVQKAITYASGNYQKYCNGIEGYKWDRVISVQAQIVNGSNYYVIANVNNGKQIKKIQVVVWVAAAPPNISITSCTVL